MNKIKYGSIIIIITTIIHISLNRYFINSNLYIINTGTFLSIFQHIKYLSFWLNAVGILIICTFLMYSLKADNIKFYTYLLLLLGGIYNLFDRILLGGVVDYFHFFNISMFNFADCLIVGGIVVYLLIQIKENK